jgi:hypothetical protein
MWLEAEKCYSKEPRIEIEWRENNATPERVGVRPA